MELDQSHQLRVETSMSLPGPIALFKEAWSMYKARFQVILSISCIAFAATLLEELVSKNSPIVASIALILSLIVTYLSYLAFIYVFAFEDSLKNYLTFYQKAWNVFVPYMMVSILTGIATLSGAMIFIIPGILFGVYFSFVSYIVALDGLKGFRALAQSFVYVKNDWWKIFGRMLFFATVVIVFSLLLGFVVGFATYPAGSDSLLAIIVKQALEIFIIMPLGIAYFYILYKAMRDAKTGPLIETEVAYVRNRVISIIVIGCIFGIILISLVTYFMK